MAEQGWTAGFGKNRREVSLHEMDRRARLWAVVESVQIALCWLTGGWLFDGRADWMWKIPLGWPKRAEDGLLDNSLAGALYGWESCIFGKAWEHRERCTVVTLPLTRSQLHALWPDSAEYDDLHDGPTNVGQVTFGGPIVTNANASITFTSSVPLPPSEAPDA